MLEKQFKDRSEIELLEIWMQSPPWAKPVLPFNAEEYLERLQLANKWLTEHGGDTRKVWPMLMASAKAKGAPISEATARRYVNEAQRLFVSINEHSVRWTIELILNDTLHMMLSAKNAGKHEAYARLAKESRGYLEMMINIIREDQERMTSPIAIEAITDVSLVPGHTVDPDIRKKAEAWFQEYLINKGMPGISDAQIIPDEPQE